MPRDFPWSPASEAGLADPAALDGCAQGLVLPHSALACVLPASPSLPPPCSLRSCGPEWGEGFSERKELWFLTGPIMPSSAHGQVVHKGNTSCVLRFWGFWRHSCQEILLQIVTYTHSSHLLCGYSTPGSVLDPVKPDRRHDLFLQTLMERNGPRQRGCHCLPGWQVVGLGFPWSHCLWELQ